jgi:hypothetical protein
MTVRREKLMSPEKAIHEQFNFQADHMGSLGIPPEQIPDGTDYLWVVESVNDKPDHRPLALALRKGWKAVPPDRHPELTPGINLGGAYKDMDRSAIRVGGLILMERSKDLGYQERRQQNEYTNQVLKQAKWANDGMADPMVPWRTFIDEEKREVY